MIVWLQDECHLVWGDTCGMVWGKRNAAIEVLMTNERERQTYYGAVNLLTHEFHLMEFQAGNGEHTVEYLRWLQSLYPGTRSILLWDGASYHRDVNVKTFLAEINGERDEKDWQLLCLSFAPNAPDQNPVEDIWLKGKKHLRKNFARNKTFASVKDCFCDFLRNLRFVSAKFNWYIPDPQIN